MGGAGLVMGFVVVVVAIVVALLVVPYLRRATRERSQVHDRAKSGAVETLRYRVPEGQDPAAVMAALRGEGFGPVTDVEETQEVLVPCPAGADRERARIRATIASAARNLDDDPLDPGAIRFVDE